MSCNRCKDSILPDDAIVCNGQDHDKQYHFGCGGLAETTFRRMGKKKTTWLCIDCRGKSGKVNVNLEEIVSDDNAAGGKTIAVETDVLKLMFKEFKSEMVSSLSELEKSVSFQSGKLDEVLTSFREMKKSFVEIQAKHEELSKENQTLKKMVQDLQGNIVEMEQKSLDHNIELSGIPESITDEKSIMESLCKVAKVDVPTVMSYTMKRVYNGEKKTRPVIICFESKRMRDIIMKEAKKAKPKKHHFTKNAADVDNVYVNEHLTPYMKDLFYKTQQIRKQENYLHLWTSEGKVLLKKTSTSKVMNIKQIEDVKKGS